MKKNNIYLPDDEIDLVAIFRVLWKDKILILIVSLLFCISAYLYAYNSPLKYKEIIILGDLNSTHKSWYCKNKNKNGEILNTFI